jgi:hypothetical protein
MEKTQPTIAEDGEKECVSRNTGTSGNKSTPSSQLAGRWRPQSLITWDWILATCMWVEARYKKCEFCDFDICKFHINKTKTGKLKYIEIYF